MATSAVFGSLYYVLFKLQVPDSLAFPILFILIFPGILPFLPYIVLHGHNTWDGIYVLSILLNWLFYTWAVHFVIVRWRNRKR